MRSARLERTDVRMRAFEAADLVVGPTGEAREAEDAEDARDDTERDKHHRDREDADAELRLDHEDRGTQPAELERRQAANATSASEARQRLLCQAGAKPGGTSHVDTHGTVVGTTLLGRSPDFVDLDDTEAGVDHALARLERAAAAGLVGPVRLVDLHGVAGSGCKERAVGQGARCASWG
jgi:hypothetical protein